MVDIEKIESEMKKFKEDMFKEDEDPKMTIYKKRMEQIKLENELKQTPEPPDIESIRRTIDLRPRKPKVRD